MQLEYSFHVKNRLYVIQSDQDTHTEESDIFIEANDEAKERYVPHKLTKGSQTPLVTVVLRLLYGLEAVS